MPIQRINRIVISVYLLITAINVASFVQFGHVRTDAQQALERQRKATLEANRMIAGSKSLTNSVRAFAATGDPGHEKAYWDEVKVKGSTFHFHIRLGMQKDLVDTRAGDLLSDLLDKLGSDPLARKLKPVATAIEGFDFDAALEKLNAI